MKKLTTSQLRRLYLDFFVERGHRLVKSDSLVPANDPSVLFTSAGMNQFKDNFLGKVKDFRRATSAQKCLRTGDLEEVGRTPFHHTFFEMLGNFSFGDYFKKEAIEWGWEFVTRVLEIDPADLWVSVYEDDSEALDLWHKHMKLPLEKIKKFGAKDNFWPSDAIKNGPNGPCGPCSEIYYQKQDGSSVEVWNLVFTQFNRCDGGVLEPLPTKNIDTGMGLERMSQVLQGVDSNYKIDIFLPIIDAVKESTEVREERVLNMIADHARAVTFCLSDGVLPSNDGRGYVVRKLIRRCAYFAQSKDPKPFVYKIVSSIALSMGDQYPELLERRDNMAQIIKAEEEKYIKNILEGGNEKVGAEIEILKQAGKNEFPADIALDLYITYGISPDFTAEASAAAGLSIDKERLAALFKEEQEKSRSSSKMAGAIFSKDSVQFKKSQFVGYEKDSCKAKIIQIVKDGKDVQSIDDSNFVYWVVLDTTPFYAESGGQVGDHGKIQAGNITLSVTDTVKEGDSMIHFVTVSGRLVSPIRLADDVVAVIDRDRRVAIKRAHTATHILQAILRKVLGPHVQQAGSFVEPDRFRFDFTHFKDISQEDLERIQGLLNEYVLKNDSLKAQVMKKDEAQKTGAIALFGEKYEDSVRVVSIGEYSKEFCGGTHLDQTGQIGMVVITSESSVGSGLRRIEALTGKLALERVRVSFETLEAAAEKLKTSPEQVLVALDQSLSRIKTLEKELRHFQEENIASQNANLPKNKVGNVTFVVHDFKDYDVNMLRQTADLLKKEIPSEGVFVLSSGDVVVCASTSSNIAANVVLQKILPLAGGTGGGRKDFAQGGIKDISKKDLVLRGAKLYIDKGGVLESL
ncbi:MAG: alanine--tRNA ligase [Candidatus Omnitrophica bacterium]|nr:alanine--tRNA ligase [Candidatus Omnitrophota bacterium]